MEALVQKVKHHPAIIVLRRTGAAVVVAAFFFGIYLMAVEEVSPPVQTNQEALVVESDTALPERLIIPKLGIDANIQSVSTGLSGSMGVPTGIHQYHDVAWYRLGPRPGEIGNAVIAGHRDTGGFGFPAVFADLGELGVGDEILVTDRVGDIHRFVVEAVEEYIPADAPLERIFGPANDIRLNLITCEGDWVGAAGQYTHRKVVYARLSE